MSGTWPCMGLLHNGIKYEFLNKSIKKNRFSIPPFSPSTVVSRCTGLWTKQAWYFYFLLERKRTLFVLCLNFGGHTDLWVLRSAVFMVILVTCGFNPVNRNEIRVMLQSRILQLTSWTLLGNAILSEFVDFLLNASVFKWKLVFLGNDKFSYLNS